jgi:hypothetical protein
MTDHDLEEVHIANDPHVQENLIWVVEHHDAIKEEEYPHTAGGNLPNLQGRDARLKARLQQHHAPTD